MNIESENTPLWYVIHTYSGYENKVATNLQKIIENRGLSDLIQEVRVPTQTVIETVTETNRSKGDDDDDFFAFGEEKASQKTVTKEVERKLYPCYVFVKMVMNPEMWHIIRNTTGVTGFVGPGSAPAPLSPAEVEAMGVEVKVIELNYEVGDSVKICSGPVAGFYGVVEKISDDKTKVTVKASMFGRETPVELDSTQVERVEQ